MTLKEMCDLAGITPRQRIIIKRYMEKRKDVRYK